MSEYFAAFAGSVIGVALGIVTVAHLGRRYEERQAAKRAAAKIAAAEAALLQTTSWQASPFSPRKRTP